jgi:ankyrin repeat protein
MLTWTDVILKACSYHASFSCIISLVDRLMANINVMQMLQQGLPVESCDYDGRTALLLACSKGQVEAAQLLVYAGADVNMKDNLGCRWALRLWQGHMHRREHVATYHSHAEQGFSGCSPVSYFTRTRCMMGPVFHSMLPVS